MTPIILAPKVQANLLVLGLGFDGSWSCAASIMNQIADSSRPKHIQTVGIHHFISFQSLQI